MAYLKTHYPLEYFTVLLSSSANSVDKISLYIQDARNLSINIVPPSINYSQYDFTIQNKTIVFGFNSIKGIGNETINKILEARSSVPNQKFTNYIQAIGKLCNSNIGLKATETLVKVGAFDELLKNESRYFLLKNLSEIYQKATTITTTGEFIIKPILKEVEETTAIQKQLDDEQFNLLGISFVEHPMIAIKQKYQGDYQIMDLIKAMNTHDVIHSLVTLVSYREIKTKTGQAMAFAKIEDDTKIIDVAVFPGVYEKVKGILSNNQHYVVTVRANERGFQALSFKEYKHV
jgi:DNA polymerase-3 subunit alpha